VVVVVGSGRLHLLLHSREGHTLPAQQRQQATTWVHCLAWAARTCTTTRQAAEWASLCQAWARLLLLLQMVLQAWPHPVLLLLLLVVAASSSS
jgi:hypothetical protein